MCPAENHPPCQALGVMDAMERITRAISGGDAGNGQVGAVLDVMGVPEGGRITLKAELLADENLGECVAVSVRDEGPGIARENIQALFEPFYTTRPEGTGLGLFITRKLVANHHGDVRVRSFQGKGSTFTVLLPVEFPQEDGKDGGRDQALDALLERKTPVPVEHPTP